MFYKMKFNRMKSRLLASLILLASLGVGAQAQTTQSAQRGGGPPNVSINDVRRVSARASNFLVSWTTQTPEATTVLGYFVKLEVGFSNNTRLNQSQLALASATSATFQFPTPPEGVTPQSFKVSLDTKFRTPEAASITTTQTFDAEAGGFERPVSSGGTLPPDRPIIQIFSIGPPRGPRPLVQWNALFNPDISIEGFKLSAKLIYIHKPDGRPNPPFVRQPTPSLARGDARQVRLQVDDVLDNDILIRADLRLDTRFIRPVEGMSRTEKEGSF